ncbi:hypothetical protein ASPACDRAFT_1856976 [Aspergillus aculeatus ATCC 16872]|uniref:RBR-type E3 ubiquitin transferase n=1 Tax=Aspergillus aculeatus (strain ATCC 16872 / CBS 172.66 / WB 5094) TaxID=690307 RepID=A0A1L9WU27_ASPA1|nr:uncharacterized protein ASPACDRAFT_1856976 [Aspergillus aculeatus ATCC 16872]OJJ99417.1 hypothetical protein ASPACDRAFT_1856976 [Aspergillus aculeatus ATCC 16872]
MDEASAQLILSLLHQDVQEEIEACRTRNNNSEPSDHELALREWASQIQQCATTTHDNQVALSIDRATYDDRVALTLAVQEESLALADRTLALRYGNQARQGQNQPAQRLATQQTHDATRILAQIDGADISSLLPARTTAALGYGAGSSSNTAAKPPLDGNGTAECVACLEEQSLKNVMQTPCSHRYCKACVLRLFREALADESLLPLRCCRLPIPPSTLQDHLGHRQAKQLEDKLIEREDPYRTYCSRAGCGQYLMPYQVQGYIGTCKICQQETCTLCKRPAHAGTECENDQIEDQTVLDLAAEQGWQRCARCSHVIELGTGCNHITYEFCYVCGSTWKLCTCAIWDETRLLLRARHVAGRDRADPPPEQEVQLVAQNLQEDHECDHDNWKRVEGAHHAACSLARAADSIVFSRSLLHCTGADFTTGDNF